jgi:hypothetical protein
MEEVRELAKQMTLKSVPGGGNSKYKGARVCAWYIQRTQENNGVGLERIEKRWLRR